MGEIKANMKILRMRGSGQVKTVSIHIVGDIAQNARAVRRVDDNAAKLRVHNRIISEIGRWILVCQVEMQRIAAHGVELAHFVELHARDTTLAPNDTRISSQIQKLVNL